MLLELHREDLKCINLSPYLRAFHNDYSVRLNSIEEYQIREENIYGNSEKQKQTIQLYLTFWLVACIYIESERGINITYEYFNDKYGIDALRTCLVCLNIDIDYFFAIFQLFPNDVEYPPDYTWVIDEPPGSGTTSSYMTLTNVDLIKGVNLVTHGNGSSIMYCKVIWGDWTTALQWSKDDPVVTDELNEIAIYAPETMSNCKVILGF